MITLITGTPGSGKSLRAVYLITQALESGRPVYTDIDGIALEGVEPAPDDWRDTPEGSLVVYDEVQRKWPSTGRPGHAAEDDIRALETHRHTGHDIIVITQHPTLVHHHVRKLVGLHIHVRRTSGAHVVTLFSSSEVFDPKDKNELRHTDKQTWRYPKRLFTAYKSATQHTHKFKLPVKLKILGLFIILLFSVLIYYFLTSDVIPSSPVNNDTTATPRADSAARPAASPTIEQQTSSIPAPDIPMHYKAAISAINVEPFPTIAGCFATNDRCRCWNDDGLPLPLPVASCRIVLAHMPRALGGFATSREPVAVDPEPESYQVASAPRWSSINGALSDY